MPQPKAKFLEPLAWKPPENSKLYRDTLYEGKIKEEKREDQSAAGRSPAAAPV